MFTYNPSNINTNYRDKVRFFIQDTDENRSFLKDEEIDALLSIYVNNINMTCAAACDAIAARFAKDADVRVSNYSTLKNSVFSKYLELAKYFRQKSTKTSYFIVPSISKSDKDAIEEDDTLVEPAFRRDMFDNPPADIDSSEDL